VPFIDLEDFKVNFGVDLGLNGLTRPIPFLCKKVELPLGLQVSYNFIT